MVFVRLLIVISPSAVCMQHYTIISFKLLLLLTRENPRYLKNYQNMVQNLFGSAPYYGLDRHQQNHNAAKHN